MLLEIKVTLFFSCGCPLQLLFFLIEDFFYWIMLCSLSYVALCRMCTMALRSTKMYYKISYLWLLCRRHMSVCWIHYQYNIWLQGKLSIPHPVHEVTNMWHTPESRIFGVSHVRKLFQWQQTNVFTTDFPCNGLQSVTPELNLSIT